MIRVFEIESEVCHNDTLSVSVYGGADNSKTDKSIRIAFGYSKKHRKNLKQFIWSMSVSSDHAFPLFQQAFSGNTADVGTYVQQWHNLIDLLGYRDFLYVADSPQMQCRKRLPWSEIISGCKFILIKRFTCRHSLSVVITRC
jgi:transposase